MGQLFNGRYNSKSECHFASLSSNISTFFYIDFSEVIPLDEDYDGDDNRVAELISAGDPGDEGFELRETDVKIRGSGKVRTGKRPQLQIQIDDGRYGDMDDGRVAKLKDNNRFTSGRGNKQQYNRGQQQQLQQQQQQQQYDDTEQGTEVPSPRGVRRPSDPYKNKHHARPTRGELAEAAFWRALGLSFPLNILGLGGLGFGGYGALGGHRNFGLFFWAEHSLLSILLINS